MKKTPELCGILDDIGSAISSGASAVYDKATDAGDFVKRKASDAYDFVGDRKDELASGLYEWGGDIVDLPGDFASSVYTGVGDLTDDPSGALYRSAGRFVDNSLSATKSVGSITQNIFQGDFSKAGSNFALLAERATNVLPRGADDIANVVSISPLSQNREMTATGMSIVGPIIAGILMAKAGEKLSSADAPDTPDAPSVDLTAAKEAYSTGKEAYKEVDTAISSAKDVQRQIEKDYNSASDQLQAAKEDARNSLPETQSEIARLKQELAQSKAKADTAARTLAAAIAIGPEAAKKALAAYKKAASEFDSTLAKATGESSEGAGNLVFLALAGVGLYLVFKS
jgi:hypothetical protein